MRLTFLLFGSACDLVPAPASCCVCLPSGAHDVRIDVVAPPLPALLAEAAGDALSDRAPRFEAVRADQRHQRRVFLARPCALDDAGIENLRPAMKTLN